MHIAQEVHLPARGRVRAAVTEGTRMAVVRWARRQTPQRPKHASDLPLSASAGSLSDE